ncbi:diaminopropionate ammonia-lyase [Enterocloster clostridioformis]|uniref:diaminopropionate ammonia-lyase n=1 Tax=Enterocloster clostridioformis TaxID=1531 RepID=UPI00080CB6DC|nr:diaminopropionate ammonia-lyase [Enterocloster clostridioformis]ANU49537.1 diaminopropionate ammonia-lyase [Lachnoclostridium sp. YL32]NDO27419.1 diaminopropionate ammonia-lyase [Enterocloster clostridioformis]OXE61279.1 diaminopropionate ammonia-lyase [Enterocloster clostridioformis]QQR01566.1 diaminopropionate ammonia-lyase [Enterocloster clostridioformis]
MSCEIKWALNKMPKTEDKNLSIMSVVEVKKARAFHESIPQYQVTPLADLKNMAEYLGLAKACVKDESYRFGLNAFKVLGGSYAIARYIAKETKRDISQMPYSVLTSRELRDEFGQATFFSATDGNHGRGVAWAANRLGQKCVIRMPVGSTENRRRHIEDEGAECTIEKVNYDDCVRMVAEEAKHAERGVVIQDTAWEGYDEIPSWIMQGYSTMADEAVEQFEERPTHVFVQAGVGSLAGGAVGYFANKYKKNPPVMVVVEAEPAACLYKGAEAADGEIRIVDGEMPTIMAGLCCGEPNITSWDILKNHVTAFLAVNDDVARRGMRMLAAPFKGDPQVVSGESGAATFGALATIMKDESYRELRLELGLNQDSKVLMFSTEGDTDPDRYKTIVWEGGLK